MSSAKQDPEAKQIYDMLTSISGKLSAVLGSKEFTSFLERSHAAIDKAAICDEAVAKVHALETRLEKAMEREQAFKEKAAEELGKLKSENKELASNLAKAEARIASMSDHPDVKATRRAELKRQAEEIAKAAKSLGLSVTVKDTTEKPEKSEKPGKQD